MSESGDDGFLQYPVFSVKHHSLDDSLLSYSFLWNVCTYAHPGIIDHLMFDCFPPYPAGKQLLGHIGGSWTTGFYFILHFSIQFVPQMLDQLTGQRLCAISMLKRVKKLPDRPCATPVLDTCFECIVRSSELVSRRLTATNHDNSPECD